MLRFGVSAKGTTLADFFLRSKKESVYQKILQKHMIKSDSFVMPDRGVELVMEKPNYAYFEDPQMILAIPGYECKVITWKCLCWSYLVTISL